MKEPRTNPTFIILLSITIVGSIPFPFLWLEPRSIAGIPLWLCTSAFFTTAMSFVTAWGILKLWSDDEGEQGD